MPIELFYVSVCLMAGYQGGMILHRASAAQRTYGIMLLADAFLAGLAYALHGRDSAEQLAGLLGAVALGGCVCLVLVPPMLRELSRRLAGRELLGWAVRVAELRELFSPGLGGRQEADVLRVVADVRAGRVDGALALLEAERTRARSPEAQRALKDRILTTLLYVNRWGDAIEKYESEPASATGPAVAAELVRAYGELGRLDRAAELVGRLEQSPEAKDPWYALVLARARLLFLAFTGRVVGVAALVSPRGPLSVLPDAARAYWLGTARLYAGDRDGARQSLAEAERAAGGETRWRQLVRERLDSAENAEVPSLSPEVIALADQLARLVDEAPAVAPVQTAARPRTARVTWALIGGNLLVFGLATWLAGGDTADPRVLARLGANIGKAVQAGEWWRLPASTFLHMGFVHLAVNMLSLWSLGRAVEPIFGSLRFFALYVIAGVGGALASTAFGAVASMSVGASGAVMGVVGAFIVDVVASRLRGKPSPWRRDLLRLLLFATAWQLAIGFMFEMIDQRAHVGGLVAGALVAVLLTPAWRLGAHRWSKIWATALAVIAAALVGYGAWGAATTTRDETVDRVGWERRSLRGVSLEVPRLWFWGDDDRVSDPTWRLQPTLFCEVASARQVAGAVEAQLDSLRGDASVVGATVVDPSFAPPEGWSATEMRFFFVDGKQKVAFRQMLFLKTEGDLAMMIGLLVPDDAIDEAAFLAPRLLNSAKVEAPSAP